MTNGKYDVVIANPPYNNGLHEKFDAEFFNLCSGGEICWVSPLSFLLGKRQKKKITLELDKYRTDIVQINGNEYFDAAIAGTIGVTHVDMGKGNRLVFDEKYYDECEGISIFSNDDLLVRFNDIIKPLYEKDSFMDHIKYVPGRSEGAHLPECKIHNEHNPQDDWLCLYVPMFGQKTGRMYKSDISENDIIKYSDFIKTNFKAYYVFDSIDTGKNFLNYVKTDFCRACLMLVQSNISLMRGELNNVPWFDFKDPIFGKSPAEIDDCLFGKYKVSDEVRSHIQEMLPDCYDIRNNIKFDGKTYNKCEEITMISNDELLSKFYDIITPLFTNENLLMHIKVKPDTLAFPSIKPVFDPDPDQFVLTVNSMRGHPGKSDFYTIMSNQEEVEARRTGLYRDVDEYMIDVRDKKGNVYQRSIMEYWFGFDTKRELDNFIKYVKSDFCRACLLVTKNNLHVTYEKVPWFDFRHPVFDSTSADIDDYLFNLYDVPDEVREHITSILPDYYNIRKNIIFDGRHYKSTEQISKFSNDDLMVQFNEIVRPLYLEESICDHVYRTRWTTCLPSIRMKEHDGYVFKMDLFSGSGNIGPTGESFYSLFSKNRTLEESVDIYYNFLSLMDRFKEFIALDSREQGVNFYNYCKTYFCRACLYLIKNTLSIGTGELKRIPWFDFTDPVFSKTPVEIDDYLFQKYNISDDVREHIENILPDYYGLKISDDLREPEKS